MPGNVAGKAAIVRSLYEKTEANPEKSLAGCLVATGIMMASVAVLALAEGSAFVWGREDWAKMLMAERRVEEVREAIHTLLEDAGVASIAQLFDPAAAAPPDMARTRDWLVEVLEQGRDAGAPLRPEIRERLKPAYLRPARDPWGRPFCISEDDGLQVYSLGKTPQAEYAADDIWSGRPGREWRYRYYGE